jgi:hypothetical protein
MQEATYHELARIEHATKARVYAKHGMHGKAASHKLRAAHHASFGTPVSTKKDALPISAQGRSLFRTLQGDSRLLVQQRDKLRQLKEKAVSNVYENDPASLNAAWDEALPDSIIEHDDAGADSYVYNDQELPARSPVRIGAARRVGVNRKVSSPRRRNSDGSWSQDAHHGADAGKSRPHSAPPSNSASLPELSDLFEPAYENETARKMRGEESPARSPVRIGAARRAGVNRRVSAPRRRNSDGSWSQDAHHGADAGKSRPHSAHPSKMSAMAVTSLLNPEGVTCAITKQKNGARKCRKRTENDEEPESEQCLYEEGKGCVLNKNKVFCVLSEKRKNTCRRARAGDIESDEDRMFCKPDEQNLCQYISEESEEESESPESRRSEHTPEEAGSYAMISSEQRRAGSGTGQARKCILKQKMKEGERTRCVFAAKGEAVSPADEFACTLNESGKRCQLREYAKGGGCMLSKRGRCKKAPRNYELTDEDQRECKMYGGKCLRTAYETQRSVRRSLPVAPLALISRPVAQAVNSDRRLDGIFTEHDPPLQPGLSPPKRMSDGGGHYEDDMHARAARLQLPYVPRAPPGRQQEAPSISDRLRSAAFNSMLSGVRRPQQAPRDTQSAGPNVADAVRLLREAGVIEAPEGILTHTEFKDKKRTLQNLHPDRDNQRSLFDAYSTLKRHFDSE